MVYKDNTWYTFAGKNMRLICDTKREAVTEVVHPTLGNCYRFTVNDGDCSSTDYYSKNERSMFAAEGYSASRDERIALGATFLWDKFPDDERQNIFRVLMQLNDPPYDGKSWGPPEFALEKGIKNTRGVITHHFHVFINKPKSDPTYNAQDLTTTTWGEWWSEPIQTGVAYSIAAGVTKGPTGNGACQIYLGTRGLNGAKPLVWDYKGHVGREDCGIPFPAFGCYRHGGLNGTDELFIKDAYVRP